MALTTKKTRKRVLKRREPKPHPTESLILNGQLCAIDVGLVKHVKLLNDNGIITTFCCEGTGREGRPYPAYIQFLANEKGWVFIRKLFEQTISGNFDTPDIGFNSIRWWCDVPPWGEKGTQVYIVSWSPLNNEVMYDLLKKVLK